MPPKPPRRTRERILRTALTLFNKFGEPAVAATSIAFEMGISPGNLYYHYHSKEQIVADLFTEFRREIEGTLAAPEKRLPHAEDCWLYLHLVFEAIWKYRFLYRDINDLVSRYHVIEVQFRRILAHKVRVAEQILTGLVKAKQIRATPEEITNFGAEHRPRRDLLDVVRIRPRSARATRRQDAGARRFPRNIARGALPGAARARAVRSLGEAVHRLRRRHGIDEMESLRVRREELYL